MNMWIRSAQNWTKLDRFRANVSGTLILSNRTGSRQRNGKKQSCSFTASIALSVLRRMAYPYLMMSAIFMGMPHSWDVSIVMLVKNNIADEDDNSPCPYHGKVETLAWAKSLGWSKRRVSNKNLLWIIGIWRLIKLCDVNKPKDFSKCINRFVSVRLFPYLPVWLDWFCELFLIQQ